MLIFSVQSASFIVKKSVTFDEAIHLAAGLSAWRTGDFRIYPKNPPLVRQLCTLPLLALGAQVPLLEGWKQARGIILINEIAAAYPGRFHSLVMAGRAVTLGMMIVLGFLIWHDAKKYYGDFAAGIAIMLFSLQPTLVAHGSLITVDAGASLFFYLAVRTYLNHQGRKRGWQQATIMGIALGAALTAKFANLSLLLILPALGLVRNRGEFFLRGRWPEKKQTITYWLAAGLTALLSVNLAYGFQGSFHRLDQHRFGSRAAGFVQRMLPPSIRIPLPYELVRGFDLQSYDNDTMGGKNALTYWRGEWVKGNLPLFFPWLIGTKFTIPLLGLALISPGIRLWRRLRGNFSAPDQVWLSHLIPIVIHFILISYLIAMYFSVRYLFQIVPFLILLAGDGASLLIAKINYRRYLRSLFLFFIFSASCISSFWIYPDYLAYTNIFLGGEERANILDADQSRDWGQDLIGLKEWLDMNPNKPLYFGYFGTIDPAVYGIQWELPPPWPAPGIWAVSQNFLKKDWPHPYQFSRQLGFYIFPRPIPYFGWLQTEKPIHQIGHSIFIYRIPESYPPQFRSFLPEKPEPSYDPHP